MGSKVALLYSGGRDSLLAALRSNSFNEIHLLTCDNCHIEGIDNIRYSVQHLRDMRTQESKITTHEILHTQAKMHKYLKPFMEDASICCPMLHCVCFACRLAMIVSAIQYCKKKKMFIITTGDREVDPYIIATKPIQKLFNKLCDDNNIAYLTPIYNVESDYDRNIEISEKGLLPKTYECKCWLGYEPAHDILHSDIKQIKNIYLNKLLPLVIKDTDMKRK